MSDQTPVNVYGDKNRLQEALLNILCKLAKHSSPESEISLNYLAQNLKVDKKFELVIKLSLTPNRFE